MFFCPICQTDVGLREGLLFVDLYDGSFLNNEKYRNVRFFVFVFAEFIYFTTLIDGQ